MGQAWTTSRNLPDQVPKTWRLFIVPNSGMTARSLDDKSVLFALKNKFDIDPNATLKLSAEKTRYCATISLQYQVSPFVDHKPFDLEISTGEDQTIIASVEPDQKFLHVTTLYDGTYESENAIDLVVVPGLAGHPYGSFKSPQNGKENWLRDYLPTELPNLRILVYGHNCNPADRDCKKSILDYATDLLDAIISYRDDKIVARRPIIFIGHSLGGLIVKQALVQATGHTDDKYKMFLEASYGFLFFGVPNRGLRHEELETILGYHDSMGQLVNDIVVNSDTEMKTSLRLLGGNFMDFCETKKLDITAFYERRATFIVEPDRNGRLARSKTNKKLMVTQDSATMIDGSSRIPDSIPLDADHTTIMKYHSIHDPLYRIVSHKVRQMVEKALRNTDELSPDQTSKLEKFKQDSSIQEKYTSIANPCLRTLENFLEKDYFKQWRDEKESPPLWICGPPGQGKSVLAKHLVKHIERRAMKPPRHAEKAIILSYFCNAQDPSCQPADILRHLLIQLLSYRRYFDHVTDNFWNSSQSFSVASMDNLWEQFSDLMLNVHARRIYCIIDALDECPQKQHYSTPYYTETERQMLVKKLEELFSENQDRMRLLLTSRPGEDDIERWFRPYHKDLHVTKDDLAIFIDEKLDEIRYMDKEKGVKEEIREQLLSQSGRTFLWVSVVIRELSHQKLPTKSELDAVLKSIPTDLKDMPLTVAELQAALTYDPYNTDGNQYTHLSEMDKYKRPLDENTIDENFGSLLTTREYMYYVYASTSWYKHVVSLGEHEEFTPQIKSLLDKNYQAFGLWVECLIASDICIKLFLFDVRRFWPRKLDQRRGVDSYRALISIILHLDVPWLPQKVHNDDLIGHDCELSIMAKERPESFRSLCVHQGEQMSQILSAEFFSHLFRFPSGNRYQSLRTLFHYAPTIQSLVSSDLLKCMEPSHEDYRNLIQFFLDRGCTITDDCLRTAARSGKEGTLEFLLDHRKIDLEIFDELLHVAIVHKSDTLSDLLNTSKIRFQVAINHLTSAIDSADLGTFMKLLQHMSHNKQDTKHGNDDFNSEIVELLFYQDLSRDCISNPYLPLWLQKVRDKVNFTKAALLKLCNSSQRRIKVTELMLIEPIHNTILIADILECLHHQNIEIEVTAEVIKTFAKRWANAQEEFRQGTSEFQRLKPSDFIINKPQPTLSYTWRFLLSSCKAIKVLLDHFEPDSQLRENLLYSAIGKDKDILLSSLRGGRVHENDQWTTLHYAAYFHDEQVVEAEFKSEAAINGTTCMGFTPLHIAVLSWCNRTDTGDGYNNRLIGWSSRRFIELLLKNNANPNICDNNGAIPLHYAALYGNRDCIERLLQSDVNIQDETGFTPLHYAVLRDYSNLIIDIKVLHHYRCVVDEGPFFGREPIRFDATDIIFQTPLHYVIQNRHRWTTNNLIKEGADLSLLDAYGRTCIESMQENELKTSHLPHLPPTPHTQRRTRLNNVIYIITSRLLDNNKSGCRHPGLYELGNCLVFLGKREEALVAYEQMLPNITEYLSISCRHCRKNPKNSFYVPIDCPTAPLCSNCRENFKYKDILAVPGPTFLNQNPDHVNDVGEPLVEWLERIRREFGVRPEVETMCGNGESIASMNNSVVNDEVSTNEEKLVAEENDASVNQAVSEEGVSVKGEELAAVGRSQFDQTGARGIKSKWSQLREATLDIRIWLVAIIVLVSAYTMSRAH
ncbi:uncharacterized protein F4807DRAFT_462313 [Annulohypoxylon truncatum]|uniref:uncharacterized protein n=1 Tax=Annulohypoxylon truncatum TaxID=327061 RepID=UPI002007E314|nr:uncharacterized protein F4807DRAFT_462313 [Annulohypoxylon truncatum]KAI1207870.1 hypothetical protein F4807DRAFT_462313 [Annulohypoxylon truncatum]